MSGLRMLLVGVVLLTFTCARSEPDYLAEIDSIIPEEQCVMQGGTCVMQEHCPQVTAIKGLCSKQRNLGVECCYGISEKETRCRKRGGECVSPNYCSPQLIFRATDCAEDTVCCILLN